MATLNIAITAPLQAFSNYADELGYQAKVLDTDGVTIIDNPEKKQVFLSRSIKSIIAGALADRAAQSLQRTKQEEAKVESENLRKAIENAITIS